MKIIAFFNLKAQTDPQEFCQWVLDRQAPVFEQHLSLMSNFQVLRLTETDNVERPGQIVQFFDWAGTAEQWRQTLATFRQPSNKSLFDVAEEWLEFCDDPSTQILYAQ